MCFICSSFPPENADQDAMNSFLDELFQPLSDNLKELDPDVLATSIKGGGGKKDGKRSVPSPPAPPLSIGQSVAATGGPPPPPPPPPPPVISTTQTPSQSTPAAPTLSELLQSTHLKSSPPLSTSPPPSAPTMPTTLLSSLQLRLPPPVDESVTSDIKLQPQQSTSAQNVVVKQISLHKIVQQRKISRQLSKDTEPVEIVETVPSREKIHKLSAQIEKQFLTTSNIQRRASRKVARTKSIYRPGTKVTAHAAVRTADPEKNIPPRPAQKISLYSPFKTSTITYNNPSWNFKLCKEVIN